MSREIKKKEILKFHNSRIPVKEILKLLNISNPKYYELLKECGVNTRKQGSGRPFGTKIKLI